MEIYFDFLYICGHIGERSLPISVLEGKLDYKKQGIV